MSEIFKDASIRRGDAYSTVLQSVLRTLATADTDAMLQLISTRVPCSEGMVNHPTIQAGVDASSQTGYAVGFLGVLNGILLDLAKVLNAKPQVVCARYETAYSHGAALQFRAADYEPPQSSVEYEWKALSDAFARITSTMAIAASSPGQLANDIAAVKSGLESAAAKFSAA
ncbi:MAG TPA: hypothetical protein VGM98_16820 [Schlesneria sp.]|jgi:hypothetical protein